MKQKLIPGKLYRAVNIIGPIHMYYLHGNLLYLSQNSILMFMSCNEYSNYFLFKNNFVFISVRSITEYNRII